MIKLLYSGDKHIRGTNPRNYTANYKDDLKANLYELFEMAREHQVDAIIDPGDLFDIPDVSNAIVKEFKTVFQACPVPYYLTVGNHDVPGYNIAAYWRTSLSMLEDLVPQLHVINVPRNEPDKPLDITPYVTLEKDGTLVQLTFTPFTAKIDINGYGYDPEIDLGPAYFKIHVAHGMLLDHTPPFDRFTLVQNALTTADLVFCGHDHTGFGIYRRADGKVFVNNGAVPRIAASVAEIERQVVADLVTVYPDKTFDIQTIPFTTSKPGAEVLDRSRIEAEKERQYAMEQFSALIQTNTGKKTLMDLNQIVETIANQEAYAPEIVQLTLAKIDAQREKAAAI